MLNLDFGIIQTEMRSYAIKVEGRVQGVGFRFYTNKKANELGICGYVKNMRDGSVFIEAEGPASAMDEFISWVGQGPQWARVDKVSQQEIPLNNYERFEIR